MIILVNILLKKRSKEKKARYPRSPIQSPAARTTKDYNQEARTTKDYNQEAGSEPGNTEGQRVNVTEVKDLQCSRKVKRTTDVNTSRSNTGSGGPIPVFNQPISNSQNHN